MEAHCPSVCPSVLESLVTSPLKGVCGNKGNAVSTSSLAGLTRGMSCLYQVDGNKSAPSGPDDVGDGNKSARTVSTPRPSGSQKRKSYTPVRTGSSSIPIPGSIPAKRLQSDAEHADDEDEFSSAFLPSSQPRFVSCREAVRDAAAVHSQKAEQEQEHTRLPCMAVTEGHSPSLFTEDIVDVPRQARNSSQANTKESKDGKWKGKKTKGAKVKSSTTMSGDGEPEVILASSRDLSRKAIPGKSQQEVVAGSDVVDNPGPSCTPAESEEVEFCDDNYTGSERSYSGEGHGRANLDSTAPAATPVIELSSDSTDSSDVIRGDPKPIIRARERMSRSTTNPVMSSAANVHHRRLAQAYNPKKMKKPHPAFGSSTDSDDVSCWPEIKPRKRIVRRDVLFVKDKVLISY